MKPALTDPWGSARNNLPREEADTYTAPGIRLVLCMRNETGDLRVKTIANQLWFNKKKKRKKKNLKLAEGRT